MYWLFRVSEARHVGCLSLFSAATDSLRPRGRSCLSGLSGLFGSSGWIAGPANKTDQIDQINEIDQFRLSVLAGLNQESLRCGKSLQPQQSHESLRQRPPN